MKASAEATEHFPEMAAKDKGGSRQAGQRDSPGQVLERLQVFVKCTLEAAHMPQQEVYEKHRKNAHRGQGCGLVRRVFDWDPRSPGFDPQHQTN